MKTRKPPPPRLQSTQPQARNRMEKQIKNREILRLTTVQPQSGKIYFVAALQGIGSYKIQSKVIELEEQLSNVADTINDQLKDCKAEPERNEVLSDHTILTFEPLKLTESELESLKPNYDVLKCLRVMME